MGGEKHNGGYEKTDADVGALGLLIGGLAVLTLVGMLVSWLVFRGMDARHQAAQPPAPPLADTRPALPPEPRLQEQPWRDLEELRRAEREILAGYEWVDRDAGIVRIPVERAMVILAERGLPAAPEPPEPRD
jgi:hypothetical protein